MKKIIALMIMAVIIHSLLFAQSEGREIRKSFLQLVASPGAGVILNSNGAPHFSYGGGLRWTNYFNEAFGLVLDAEYSHRGGYWNMNCLDFNASFIAGKRFFSELGFYYSPILSSNAAAYDWDGNSKNDMGGLYALGYNFKNGMTVGANVHMGLKDLTTDRLPLGGGYYKINQINLHWGAFVAFRIL
jgi:hypothetical protein